MAEPITREEIYLDSIANGEETNLKPITREEMFLAKAGGQNVKVPTPITRKEKFLSKISGASNSKPEQEKTVEITKNGTTEITADEGKALSKVTAVVNVPTSTVSKLVPFINSDKNLELTEADLVGLVNPLVKSAFMGKSLKSVELPPHIINLSDECFKSSRIDTIRTYATSLGDSCFYFAFSREHSLDLYLLANEFKDFKANIFRGETTTIEEPQLKIHFNDNIAFNSFLRALMQSEYDTTQAFIYRTIYFQDTLATELEIASDITAITKHPFRCLLGVSKIKFLGDVTTISNYSFYRARNLAEIDLTACTTVPILEGNRAFDKISYGAEPQIKVPSALYDEWISATNWSALADKDKIVAV